MRVLIGFLFACTAAVLAVEEETTKNDIFTAADYALFKDADMYVYDDNENLVKLTLDDTIEEQKGSFMDMQNNVFFFLHTKKNPIQPQTLYVNDDEILKMSNFNPANPTRFITHGWMNSRESPACTLIRDAYLQHGDYNVIVIDWSKISIGGYIYASGKVKAVAQFISTMINFLQKHGLDVSQTTMVGHSLGAHVVGLAARGAQGDINYVVGLDPALPGFYLARPGSRISNSDGTHVEIIHTNGGLLGFLTAIGDSDFYPNGGSSQLGCLVDIGGACSHARAYRFFAESINSPRGFHGRKCASFIRFKLGLCRKEETSIMGGMKVIVDASGTYYLSTKSGFPFALGRLF